ncbi:MAG: sensor histidine kinase, partial [Roseiflexus sp.]|nr:sensor histidine kinase [Roseiflexus sp.]
MSPRNQKFDIRSFGALPEAVRAWWRAALPNRTMIVAVVMIVGALIAAVTAQPETPLWQRGVVIGALSILLALNLIPSSDVRPHSTPLGNVAIYLSVASALYFIAFGMSSGPASTVISMLLFLLVGQATWTLPLAAALIYAGGMAFG